MTLLLIYVVALLVAVVVGLVAAIIYVKDADKRSEDDLNRD